MALIDIRDLTFAYPGSYDNVFEHLSLQLDTHWRLGLVGRNGRGKTTLLRLLQRQYEYDGAISVPVPLDCFPSPVSAPERDTLTILEEQEPGLELWRIYKELDMLEVDAGVLFRPYSSLSGGEQVKVLLAALFLREGAFLLLDEPTNHLDLDTKEALDKALGEFPGTILMVSHDRYLLSKVPTKIAEMTPAGMTIYQGGYAAYARGDRPILTPEQPEPEPVPAVPEKKSEASTTYYRGKKQRAEDAKRRKRLDTLEKEIAADEEEIQRLTEFMAGEEAASDYEKLTEAANRMEELQQGLTAKYEEWSELSE